MATASTITAPSIAASTPSVTPSAALYMEIRIKTLNDHTFSLTVARSVSIRDLKITLQSTTAVPPQRQRLIYRGKLLRDGDLLSAYNVEDGHTVHLVARPDRAQQPTSPIPSPSLLAPLHDTAEMLQSRLARLDASTASSLATMRRRLGVDSGFSTSLPPSSRIHHDRLQFLRSRYGSSDSTPSTEPESEASTFAPPPSVEHIRQSLMTIQSMLSLPATNDDAAAASQRQFFVGQWLDVKDTVNQWLEGTILDMNADQVFVHYHGWPSRWDEWIDRTSPRLAAFRTRTLHGAGASRHLSPAPTLVSQQPATANATPATIRALLPQMQSVLREMMPFVDALAGALEAEDPSTAATDSDDDMSESTSPQVRQLVATVAPLFDRVGRLLADAAPGVQALAGAQASNHRASRSGHFSDIPSFRELIAVSELTPHATPQPLPRRSIDVHIHAILAPNASSSSSFASELDGIQRWRELSERLSRPSLSLHHARGGGGGGAVETSPPLVEELPDTIDRFETSPPQSHLSELQSALDRSMYASTRSPTTSPMAPTFMDVIRRTMNGFTPSTSPLASLPGSTADASMQADGGDDDDDDDGSVIIEDLEEDME